MKLTKQIQCAGCGNKTLHDCSVDKNDEVICECEVCKRALKFPLTDPATFESLIAAHEENAKKQISLAALAEEDKTKNNKLYGMLGLGRVI